MMNRETLNARHKTAVGRYHRAMVDGDGLVPDGLLDELAAIADEHALDETAAPAPSTTARTRHRNRTDGTAAVA
jgi:hypothetical protein